MNRTLSILLLLSTSMILSSCLTADPKLKSSSDQMSRIDGTGSDGVGDGDGLTNVDGTVGGDSETPAAKVEIRFLIEPKIDDDSDGGEYNRKLTVPKNYNGFLYVAGINISSIADQNISVRFKFGVDSSEIVVPAVVSTAPGLTPQTDVEVLILDMRARPFEDIQLLYDLYDYNSYDFDGTGSDPGALTVPVNLNRDDKLFCRGLSLKDDSTFKGNLVGGCSGSTDICKYSYAKVVDKGLILAGTPDLPIVPSEINAMKLAGGYFFDTDSVKLDRCLPNNPDLTASSYIFDGAISFTSFGTTSNTLIGTDTYYYNGPYRAINGGNWEIRNSALLNAQFGIFQTGISDVNTDGSILGSELDIGYRSFLFPLYSKFDLLKDTQYMGSTVPNLEKVLTTMAGNGESLWMDGCNSRASTVHDITGEHIGSCSVTATIEIIATASDGTVSVLDMTDEVKLQLVKPATLNTTGDNVLLSSFEQCSSSNQCGSDSCCINNRCWSKSVASSCIEDLPSFGNQETGELCNTDYQCASLCCNKIDGRCAPHNTISESPSFCSKPTGQSCVAKEWCQKTPVTSCGIVSTGTDAFGGVTCALRCITVEVFGECTADDGTGAGTCKPACQPPAVIFNPNDPNRCNAALSFIQLQNIANNPVCQ